MQKPIKRTGLRLLLGQIYYRIQKNFYWYFSWIHFGWERQDKRLKFEISEHKTPLLRKLKDVEMYLQYNKIENLKIAIQRIDGLILKKGEIFSYWRNIGEPTKKKGYKMGMVLKDGKFEEDIGGGLCQLSNLVYWITLHTPLTIIERWRHTYDVFPDAKRSQPFWSGATCSYPAIDLQIKNNISQSFQLKLWFDNEYLYGCWYSNTNLDFIYEIYEQDHKFESQWWGGYTRHNKIFRKKIDKLSGEIIENQFLIENNAVMMYNPLLEK